MRFYDLIFLALSTLIRYPLRTIMLLVATSIGVMAVILLTAVGEGARDYTKTPSISVCEGRNWRREDYKTRSEQCLRGYKS